MALLTQLKQGPESFIHPELDNSVHEKLLLLDCTDVLLLVHEFRLEDGEDETLEYAVLQLEER